MVDLDAAYDACVRECRAHYENFPVASRLLPRAMRPHVAALYAFARAADDLADEGTRTPEERLQLLDRWRCRLHAALSDSLLPPPVPGEPANTQLIFLALGASVRSLQLPPRLFDDLLSAFRQDVIVARYETWASVLDYCQRSANPVGRLVLRIGGYANDELDRWSDSICTALQLTNFWQDLFSDFDRGRLYLPLEEIRAHGADEQSLIERRLSREWKQALAAAACRTRALFIDGRPLCDHTRGRLRFELRATWLGGVGILDRLQRVDYDVLHRRPTMRIADVPWLAASVLCWPLTIRRHTGDT